MPLIKCPDCGKSVSDKSAACVACGCPLGGGGSVGVNSGNVAFENRIQEYRNNNYKIVKRFDNSVKMAYKGATSGSILAAVIGMLFIFAGFFRLLFFWSYIFIDIGLMVVGVFGVIGAYKRIEAFITITKTGELEETGLTLDILLKHKNRRKK